jgi:hypothetical protein
MVVPRDRDDQGPASGRRTRLRSFFFLGRARLASGRARLGTGRSRLGTEREGGARVVEGEGRADGSPCCLDLRPDFGYIF